MWVLGTESRSSTRSLSAAEQSRLSSSCLWFLVVYVPYKCKSAYNFKKIDNGLMGIEGSLSSTSGLRRFSRCPAMNQCYMGL